MEKFVEQGLHVATRDEACPLHGTYVSSCLTVGTRPLPWSTCPTCARLQSAQMEREARCVDLTERQRRLETRLQKSGIPRRYREKGFAAFQTTCAAEERALGIAQHYATNFQRHAKRGATLVFAGAPGTGKSHLALATAMEVMKTDTVLYLCALDLIRAVRDTWRQGAPRSESDVLRELSEVGLLIIDEVGMQYGSDSERMTLFDVIDKRYRDLMPMILVSNLNRNDMKKLLGERSFDRLRECATWVVFDWQSRRGET